MKLFNLVKNTIDVTFTSVRIATFLIKAKVMGIAILITVGVVIVVSSLLSIFLMMGGQQAAFAADEKKAKEVIAYTLINSVREKIDETEWAEWWLNSDCVDGLDYPTKTGFITSPNGYRSVPSGTQAFNISKKNQMQINKGTDFFAPIGTTVTAITDGEIIYAGNETISGAGLQLTLAYKKGVNTCYANYNHLSGFLVEAGTIVKRGQPVALSGDTGNTSGAHLDLALYTKDGDKYQFIDWTSELALNFIAKNNNNEHIKLIIEEANRQGVKKREQLAYILATAEHESNSFQSFEEIDGARQAERLGYSGGRRYFGRGYVQLTHDHNYSKYAEITKRNLLEEPEQVANDRQLAAFILVHGMLNGSFTGAKLSSYINENQVNFVGARRVVNGNDRAEHIANIATKYLGILTKK